MTANAGRGKECRRINLALQGGGAHGAFTWGVLDRLLEDERVEIEGISGTSAGAFNGAILAQAYHKGGGPEARQALDRFWQRVSELGWLSPVHRGFYERLTGSWNLDDTPAAVWVDQLSRVLSPYQTNPLNFSPLRALIESSIDLASLRASDAIKLFITATNVRTGKPRIFSGSALSVDALLASACLPQIFQAVIIEGDPYWDGGYMGNPALYPLIYHCESRDIVIVQVNPMVREGVPQSAAEIMNRLNEITFNAALMGEMRAISFVERLISSDATTGPEIERLKRMLIHVIEDEEAMKSLGVASKLNTDLDFLLHLKHLGRKTASRWLERNFAALNRRSSVDIRARYL